MMKKFKKEPTAALPDLDKVLWVTVERTITYPDGTEEHWDFRDAHKEPEKEPEKDGLDKFYERAEKLRPFIRLSLFVVLIVSFFVYF